LNAELLILRTLEFYRFIRLNILGMKENNSAILEIGKGKLTIEAVYAAVERAGDARLRASGEFEARIEAGAAFLDKTLAEIGGIYGVTTGYGDSCTETVPPDHYYDLPVNLTRYHGCGLGEFFDAETTRAIMIVRLNTLAQGYSGVSIDLLKQIGFFIENNILPLIPRGLRGRVRGPDAPVLPGRGPHRRAGRALPGQGPAFKRRARRTRAAPVPVPAQGGHRHHERHGGDERGGCPGLYARRLPGGPCL
jgi:hypothetical protein